MGRILKFLTIAIIGLGVIAGVVVFSGAVVPIIVALFGPKGDFDPATFVSPPDYGDPANWAALASTKDLADLTPTGVTPRGEAAQVDVFFIHPTGYLNSDQWNSPMDPNSLAEENTKWMMANQASAFNGCCDIYAPRYREASIFSYFAGGEMTKQSLAFAFGDVERAFDHFLDNFSKGRPFIIATHSQGTSHGIELLKRRIDKADELRERLVAAYVIGSSSNGGSKRSVGELQNIQPCDDATEVGCLIHWATYAEGATGEDQTDGPGVCVNPLSWRNDGGRADASQNVGAVDSSGQFTVRFWGDGGAQGIEFDRHPAPLPNHTWAECKNGMLIVVDQSDGPLQGGRFGKNYHGLDYALFYLDIRRNAIERVEAYLER
jgi:hypothetical protein